jgi:hypothetical protein
VINEGSNSGNSITFASGGTLNTKNTLVPMRVAEITGRSRRVRKSGDGIDRLAVGSRVASANLAEAQAFMDDEKSILVFSDAGGTGREYSTYPRGPRSGPGWSRPVIT